MFIASPLCASPGAPRGPRAAKFAAAMAATILVGAVLPGAAGGETARADTPVTRSRTVYVGDLDFTNRRDRLVLQRRISEAARDVCGPPWSWATYSDMGAAACVRRARSGAMAELKRAMMAHGRAD